MPAETDTQRIAGTELDVFPLGLGGNVFGMTADITASEEVLDAFTAAGGNMIDTADSYSAWVPGNQGGESETILGDWMRRRGNRQQVIMATKVGAHPEFEGLHPDNITRAAEASLGRLQTDVIDLYYAHRDDEDIPIAEIAGAFDRLAEAGKIRYVAISKLSPERIEGWLQAAEEDGLVRPVALQPEYNLVSRQTYEEDYGPLAEAQKLGVFPFFGLASGFLTGKYRTREDLEGRARGQAVAQYLTPDGLGVLDALDRIAEERGAAMATVALAWLLAKPTVTAPLASATSVAQLEELLAAPGLELSEEEVAALDEASQPFA